MSQTTLGGPVVDTSKSQYAVLTALPTTAVRFSDSFWAPRIAINQSVTLPSQYKRLWETGRLRNFQRAAGTFTGPFEGIFFNDSDVYKWLEAAAYTLAVTPTDDALRAMIDECISLIAAAQDTNGYLNTYFSVDRVHERWTDFDKHEMYCAGHLIQAAVAHVRATGDTKLLDVAKRFADHIIDTFGSPETGKRDAVCGHEEIEMALVELSRATGDTRYLTQAQYFVDARGRNLTQRGAEFQDHIPFRQLAEVTGHAVRAVYLECAGADIYAETGEKALFDALETQWANFTQRRMYVTGGAGTLWAHESFGRDYELPSDTAYTETCAAIGSLMWNWRMLLATGTPRYADIMELALYNGIISGLSLTGDEYFYQNPLANNGAHRRQGWFGCSCCPPNIARLLASLTGYVATTSDDTLSMHLYAACTIDTNLPDGRRVALEIDTRYPWDGDVAIKVIDAPAMAFTLRLRIPEWATSATVNGAATTPGQYAEITNVHPGDTIRLALPMPTRNIEANPAAHATVGRIAIARGPVVYCVEQVDHEAADIRTMRLSVSEPLTPHWSPELLGGVVVLEGQSTIPDTAAWGDGLYRPADRSTTKRVPLRAIPYYAWANRAPGAMTVWMPEG